MTFDIRITDDAARDLEEIYEFILQHDSLTAATHVLDKIEKSIEDLKTLPHRERHPKELASLGIKDYREIFFKPYRILYRVQAKSVFIFLIADGRRDMQTLLSRRLLGP